MGDSLGTEGEPRRQLQEDESIFPFMKPTLRILDADSKDLLSAARDLFLDYERSLPFDLDFQNFDEEVSHLPGEYSRPGGCILVALGGDHAAGCVALRTIGDGICEMKRLYVRPEFRGLKLGRRLAERVIGEAKKIGYGRMRLDTVSGMIEAIALYRSFGFKEIPQYRVNPLPDAMFFELDLAAQAKS